MTIGLMLEGPVPGAVTWAGTVAGLVGLFLTYRQAKLARKEAKETSKTVKALERTFALSKMNTAISQVDMFRMFINLRRYDVALDMLSVIRRSVFQVHKIFVKQHSDQATLDGPSKGLSAIEKHLKFAVKADLRFSDAILTKALAGLDELFVEIESFYVVEAR